MGAPLVSVIIPTYNRAHVLPEAIESVFAQGVDSLELIVVDDGSTDDTSMVLDRWSGAIRVIRQPNLGIAAARNAGVEVSTGQFIAFLDSDDFWRPRKLAIQLEALENDPDLEAVYGHVRQFYDPSVDEAFRRRHPIKTEVGAARQTACILIRRESFFRVGLFDRDCAIGGIDVDWGMQANAAGLRSEILPDIVYERRLHPDQISTKDSASANRDRLLSLKRGLDRRRMAEATQSDGQTKQEQ